MENLIDLTENFANLYHPKSALIIYAGKNDDTDIYVEHFDMDKNGNLINAHPLTVREANALSKSLQTAETEKKSFLKSQGILGSHILQVNPTDNGRVIWFTKATNRNLFFVENLGIPNGMAGVPSMIWVANRNQLSVYALKSQSRPTEKTLLYHAPFFNVYKDGAVCMGTVNVEIKKSASLETFITAWENYFFNSYFSHLMNEHNPVKGNCVMLWKKLVNAGEIFPKESLKKTGLTLKNLLT
ncbi:PRTRC system protein B [Chryseobacterium sp. IHB B 17019]|uniref:PRTRC system protein B n=1 Tax=Chryseobacterium sp. IHB B 17019 TaxID=1721091 RepID=UPI00071EEB5C|nr:PRTRC system protein B [Chryseobacterium sp. IHB B 17019]ALR32446.1 PRTRC system protein B [Chryseobacterium sp. IHB B 17019]